MTWVCEQHSEVPADRALLGGRCPWCRRVLTWEPDEIDDARAEGGPIVRSRRHPSWGTLKFEDGILALGEKTFTAIGHVELGEDAAESAARRAERYRIQAQQVERTWPLFRAAIVATARATYPQAKIIEIGDEIIIQLPDPEKSP
jgi:hypothetical protein